MDGGKSWVTFTGSSFLTAKLDGQLQEGGVTPLPPLLWCSRAESKSAGREGRETGGGKEGKSEDIGRKENGEKTLMQEL